MNVDIPPDLHLQMHQIQIQLWRSDLLLLIVGKQKNSKCALSMHMVHTCNKKIRTTVATLSSPCGLEHLLAVQQMKVGWKEPLRRAVGDITD